jgi:energy-coupling factor transporter transmembrane protein EcfT
MNEPTIRIVVLLQALCVVSFLTLPIPVFFSFLGVNTLLLTLKSAQFRARLPSLVKLGAVWAFFLILVGTGRVIGGENANLVWGESVKRLGFLATIFFVMTMAYLCVKPKDYLRTFDKVRIPREVSYIFLSVISFIDYVHIMGQRQLHLLAIKGLGPRGIAQRVRAYYRILGPLFSVLLSRQVVHSRSMTYRGFYDGVSTISSNYPRLSPGEVQWIAVALLNFVSCLLVSAWLSR